MIQFQIIEDYKNMSNSDILKKYHISEKRMYKILKNNNIPTKKNKISDNDKQEIIKLYLNNTSTKKICELYKISTTLLYNLLKKNNISIKKIGSWKRKVTLNENFFEIIDTEDKAYFLGLLAADGNISTKNGYISLELKHSDQYLVQKFSYCLCNQDITFKRSNRNMFVFSICSKKIKQDLAKLNITSQKSLTLKLSPINDDLFHHFLRGYFDGDGWICTGKNNYSRPTKNFGLIGSKNFIKSIILKIKNLYNIDLSIEHPKNKKIWICRTGNINKIIKLYNILYKNNPKYFMCRKRKKLSYVINYFTNIYNMTTKSGKKMQLESIDKNID